MSERDIVPKAVKEMTRVLCTEPPLTQQSAKDECDINLIVESAKRGADLSKRTNMRTPMYGDFTNLPDYRESLLMVNKARDMFMTLDPFVRERFGNDPGRLLEFLADDSNRDEAVRLGLINPPVESKDEGPTSEAGAPSEASTVPPSAPVGVARKAGTK